LAAIKQNFDGHFSSFEHRKVHVQLMLLNYLEICAKLNQGDQQKDPALLAKAMTLGIETMRLAEEGNNSTMGNNLVKQVEVNLNFGSRFKIILHDLFSQLSSLFFWQTWTLSIIIRFLECERNWQKICVKCCRRKHQNGKWRPVRIHERTNNLGSAFDMKSDFFIQCQLFTIQYF
jgi:hypothetical protein